MRNRSEDGLVPVSCRVLEEDFAQLNDVCKSLGVGRSIWLRTLISRELNRQDGLPDGSFFSQLTLALNLSERLLASMPREALNDGLACMKLQTAKQTAALEEGDKS